MGATVDWLESISGLSRVLRDGANFFAQTAGTGRFNLVVGIVTMLIGTASALSIATSGFIFHAAGHLQTFIIFAAITGMATVSGGQRGDLPIGPFRRFLPPDIPGQLVVSSQPVINDRDKYG